MNNDNNICGFIIKSTTTGTTVTRLNTKTVVCGDLPFDLKRIKITQEVMQFNEAYSYVLDVAIRNGFKVTPINHSERKGVMATIKKAVLGFLEL